MRIKNCKVSISITAEGNGNIVGFESHKFNLGEVALRTPFGNISIAPKLLEGIGTLIHGDIIRLYSQCIRNDIVKGGNYE